jgi:hypothetical protein
LKKTIYGLATEDRGLFLQCDILKKAEENINSKMSSSEINK